METGIRKLGIALLLMAVFVQPVLAQGFYSDNKVLIDKTMLFFLFAIPVAAWLVNEMPKGGAVILGMIVGILAVIYTPESLVSLVPYVAFGLAILWLIFGRKGRQGVGATDGKGTGEKIKGAWGKATKPYKWVNERLKKVPLIKWAWFGIKVIVIWYIAVKIIGLFK